MFKERKHFECMANLKPLNNRFVLVYKEEAIFCYNLLVLTSDKGNIYQSVKFLHVNVESP